MIHPKIKAVGVAGMMTTVIVAIFRQIDVDITPTEATAVAGLVLFAAGYRKSSDDS